MAKIPANKRQLKNSFKWHYHVYKKISTDTDCNPSTRRLLLFYSVESGLKYYLLENIIHKNTTDDLENHAEYGYLKKQGHDIRGLIKSARIGTHSQYQLRACSLPEPIKRRLEPEQLHQIWRYGIKIDVPDYEDESEKVLKNVANWLEKSIFGGKG